jgi:hypothetical protein
MGETKATGGRQPTTLFRGRIHRDAIEPIFTTLKPFVNNTLHLTNLRNNKCVVIASNRV